MKFHIVPVARHWEVQVQGPYNWIAIADEKGEICEFQTEREARTEMERRIRLFAPPTRKNKIEEVVPEIAA